LFSVGFLLNSFVVSKSCALRCIPLSNSDRLINDSVVHRPQLPGPSAFPLIGGGFILHRCSNFFSASLTSFSSKLSSTNILSVDACVDRGSVSSFSDCHPPSFGVLQLNSSGFSPSSLSVSSIASYLSFPCSSASIPFLKTSSPSSIIADIGPSCIMMNPPSVTVILRSPTCSITSFILSCQGFLSSKYCSLDHLLLLPMRVSCSLTFPFSVA